MARYHSVCQKGVHLEPTKCSPTSALDSASLGCLQQEVFKTDPPEWMLILVTTWNVVLVFLLLFFKDAQRTAARVGFKPAALVLLALRSNQLSQSATWSHSRFPRGLCSLAVHLCPLCVADAWEVDNVFQWLTASAWDVHVP